MGQTMHTLGTGALKAETLPKIPPIVLASQPHSWAPARIVSIETGRTHQNLSKHAKLCMQHRLQDGIRFRFRNTSR